MVNYERTDEQLVLLLVIEIGINGVGGEGGGFELFAFFVDPLVSTLRQGPVPALDFIDEFDRKSSRALDADDNVEELALELVDAVVHDQTLLSAILHQLRYQRILQLAYNFHVSPHHL